MADGLTHHIYYKRIIPLAAIIGTITTIYIWLYLYKYIDPLFFLFFYCINYCLGAVINPDNDQFSITLGEGIVLRKTKKFHIGFIGACHVAYWFIYAYLIGLIGGHRSAGSHGWIIGTFFRIIYFNLPLTILLILFYNFGMIKWNWQLEFTNIAVNLMLNWWVAPYLLSQFIAWIISDGMHLILDTEWAKYRLYTPISKRKEQDLNE